MPPYMSNKQRENWVRSHLLIVSVLTASAFCAAATTGHAQDLANRAVQQSQGVTSQTSISKGPFVTSDGTQLPNDGSEEDKQSDSDLGETWMLKSNQRIPPFTVFSDVSLFHTSNVALGH